MAGRVVFRLRLGRLFRDPQVHRLLHSCGVWRHSCLWHSDATWPTSHFVAGRRTSWCLTSDKRGDLPEGVDHPGFRSAVREAPPLDRFVISHASVKTQWPRFQAEAPGSVRILCPGSTAVKADCIGQSKRHGQLCQFPHETSKEWNRGATSIAWFRHV